MTTTETRSILADFMDTLSGMDTMTDKELSNAVWERFWRDRSLTLREQLRDIATRADSMTEVELSHAIRAAYDSQKITWNTFEPLPNALLKDFGVAPYGLKLDLRPQNP